MNIKGYNIMRINPHDAEKRDIETKDVVRIYNDRGSILCAAYVTERIMPGVIRVPEGGWYTPLDPGDPNSLDIGGNPNALISKRQPEPLCDGISNGARVEVEMWR
jgi:anaerobic selenocysteine-containing dehydrogenase